MPHPPTPPPAPNEAPGPTLIPLWKLAGMVFPVLGFNFPIRIPTAILVGRIITQYTDARLHTVAMLRARLYINFRSNFQLCNAYA